MAVGKKQRFEVFKRDGFECQYCGAKPPTVVLEVDHILPRAKGGKDETDNLTTACCDCNRGKSDVLLSSVPQSLAERHARIVEREEQYRGYACYIATIRRRENRDVQRVCAAFESCFPDRTLTEQMKVSIKRNFLTHIDAARLCEFMLTACDRCHSRPMDAVKYFCGMCWRTIKEGR